MKIIPSRRQWLALAAVKLLALGAVFGQPPTTHPFIQAAYAAPAADAGFDGALREFDAARADEKRVDVAVAALRALPADPQRQPLQAAYLGSALAIVLRGENLTSERVVTRKQASSIDLGAPRTLWIGVKLRSGN